MKNGKKIAVITARGGSKRIPKKNIKEFCGMPIISYSIKTAIESGIFDEVMVSTDSKEIAEISKKYGAVVPFMRSEKTSDDFATTEDVILEVLENYKNIGKEFEQVCCLYPTAPFVTSNILKKATEIMDKSHPAVVIPIVQFSYPPQRCFIIDEFGYAKFKYPEYIEARSQDLEKQYHDVGQFYIYNVEKLVESNGKIADDFMPIIISEMQAQDIDNEDDWKLAEIKYKYINNI